MNNSSLTTGDSSSDGDIDNKGGMGNGTATDNEGGTNNATNGSSNSRSGAVSGGTVAAIVVVLLLVLAALLIAAVLVGILFYRRRLDPRQATQATKHGMQNNLPKQRCVVTI